ncbi:hypothetical protein INS49_011001 [Diaporthe citri]|uniref:uncharacterized protein n=1 Tax=Diaporthe citri TaxID=83186 RepID=UPI001C82671A|nr:uncharacterized protein INS49_011001 [Diaporthe citri]KAG6359947.1 hypothetical protein INS49_011001 [Diaporthe citri]
MSTDESQNSVDPSSDIEEDIEEGRGAYQVGGFHPVYVGDLYHRRYEVLTDEKKFRALKVLSAECYDQGTDTYEREILRHLRNGSQDEAGYPYVCHLIDDFEHKGPNGTHVCLVFELMGETLASFGVWLENQRIPYILLRKFTLQLICALDFAHGCNVIHTDLKPDNIFVKFRDFSLIEEDYLSKDFYGFDVVLGDWGVSSWADRHLTEWIQPVKLRAPEVLIQAPWDAKADVWNLGAIILELYRNVRMFSGRVAPDGRYDVRQHLAEIVDFFGPFPQELLQRGSQRLVKEFFDDEGRVKGAQPVKRPGLSSEYFTPGSNQLPDTILTL